MARIMLRELLKGDTQTERVGINVVNENYTTVKRYWKRFCSSWLIGNLFLLKVNRAKLEIAQFINKNLTINNEM